MTAKKATRSENSHVTTRRRGRMRRRFVAASILLLVAIALVWLAPVIVAHTALKQQILAAVLSDFEGSVTVGSASLSWLSPVEIGDVEAYDGDGHALGNIPSLRTEKSLLVLLSDRTQLGRISIDRPTVHLTLRADGSNWQDALQPLLTGPPQSTTLQRVGIEVIGGRVEVLDATSGDEYRVDPLSLTLEIDEANPLPLHLAVHAALSTGQHPPGAISLDMTWRPGQVASQGQGPPTRPSGEGRMTISAEPIPLKSLAAVIRQVAGDLQIDGTADCNVSYQWNDATGTQRIELKRLVASNVSVTAPQWLGEDRLQTARLNASAIAEGDPTRWRVQSAALATDFADLQLHGSMQAGDISGVDSLQGLSNRLAGQAVHLEGQLDLAQLAGMLPTTLNLRPSTQLQSGTVKLWLDGNADDQPGWTGGIEATDLAAVDGGVLLRQQDPIRATAAITPGDDGLTSYKIDWQSTFLQATVRATGPEGSMVVREADLSKFSAEVGPFCGLSKDQLTGYLAGDIHWRRSEGSEVDARGKLQLRAFRFSGSTDNVWTEDQLSVNVAATAELREGRLGRVLSASAVVAADGDQLSVELSAPVDSPSSDSTWPIHLQCVGQLARWSPRLPPLQSLLSQRSIDLRGEMKLETNVRVASRSVDAESLYLEIADFQASGPDLAIAEPSVRLEGQCGWNRDTSLLVARTISLNSATLAFNGQNVALQMLPSESSVSGSFRYRADLQRLSHLFHANDLASDQHFAGVVTGDAQVSYANGVSQLDWTGEGTDLAYGTNSTMPSGTVVMNAGHRSTVRERWREQVVQLSGRERYHHRDDTLEIEGLRVETPAVRLSTRGRVQELTTRCTVDLTGEVQGDLASLSERFRAILGPNIRLVGQDNIGRFAIKGPLGGKQAAATDQAAGSGRSVMMVSTAADRAAAANVVSLDLTADASVAWQSANVHGLIIGNGDVNASLDQGVIRFAPLEVPVSGGRFLGRPWIDLRAQPVSLRIDQGPLVDNVRISPEMCSEWMKYVAPLLSDATRAEGRFSMALDSANVPLADQKRSDVHGQFTIHSAKVGPGPLAQQFISLAREIKSVIDGRPLAAATPREEVWLVVPSQSVQFDVRDGRVAHQRLVVHAGDLQISTSGSVGLDESLALVVEVPVRDQWVAGRQYLDALRGTVIKLPVSGTFSQPRIDNRALGDLSRQMIGGAAGRALENELNRGLKQLFGR